MQHNGAEPSVVQPESVTSSSAVSGLELDEAVRQELKNILESRYFKTAGRSRQFLEYVVRHKLSGQAEQLKERTIGTDVFHRPADYATGDDPVVRVQAGEVRRRLEQFYQHDGAGSTIKIELPVGSYCPEFHFAAKAPLQALPSPSGPSQVVEPVRNRPIYRNRVVLGIGAACVAVLILIGVLRVMHPSNQRSVMQDFWAPVQNSQQPALICLAKGVTYRPSAELYARYRLAHPEAFQTEVEKSSLPLPLSPDETIKWRDLLLYSDYGVATGDVYAAVRISGTLGQLGKPVQLRIGSDYTFQDLRNSPGVIVGAFNNKWTLNLISTLRFAFVEQNGRLTIHEQIPNGRSWTTEWSNSGDGGRTSATQTIDHAIVARLMDSNTGQFTVLAAGLAGAGTEAAGEFISSPEMLERAYRNAPSNWRRNSSIFVLKTKVTDGVSGPPTIEASYFW